MTTVEPNMHHLPIEFDEWEKIKYLGKVALSAYNWRGTSNMLSLREEHHVHLEVNRIMGRYGLKLANWVIFVRPPYDRQLVHTDREPFSGERARSGLNIVIEGGAGARMEWFADRPVKPVTRLMGSRNRQFLSRYFMVQEQPPADEQPIEVCTTWDTPVLTDIYTPHRVIAGPEHRAMLTLRFEGNEPFDELVAHFRQPV